MEPLAPTLVVDRFEPLAARLLELLEPLDRRDWDRPTVCSGWRVRELVGHLVDTALRRLAFDRDADPAAGALPPLDDAALAAMIHAANAEGARTFGRLGGRLLIDLLRWVEPQLVAHFAALDPFAPARFAVSWAGEQRSDAWFDVARELTERWHHQQQLRLALGAPALVDPFFSRPVFETLLRVLPHAYRDVPAIDGAELAVRVVGVERYAVSLVAQGGSWRLYAGERAKKSARIELDEEPAWRLLTNGLRGETAFEALRIEGDVELARPFAAARAVIV